MSSVYKNLLIFDIHGQLHPEDWIELGYLLDMIKLNNDLLSETRFSSVNALKVSSGYSIEEVIRGRASLDAFMDQQGFRVVPSPSIKSPGKGNYFTGGFTSSYHKSSNVNTIQMEFPSSLRTTLDNFKNDGAKLAKSI
ncbi:pglyrp1 isoform X3 [Brachionus plicatilis]|uniref:Pglyrp1 isoform X3 n=1 Tax=Brachionus plicatilis TaxID=10195 RepID=A0A3M7QH45_BRAPC|nr:pglyrp1 isoform X3 [Brachionus plicatilis]